MPTKPILLSALADRGFKHESRLLHVFAGGSHLHGARIPGKNDLDVYGIFIETPEMALGLDREEHFVTSTSDEGSKNTASDVDYQLYTLRKWATLAAKGNPTVLGYLFAPPTISGIWADMILPRRELFMASSHAKGFLGMGRNQLHRLQGFKGAGKHGQREDEKGYDTKAAMHMIRMMHECLEFLRDGKITYPRPEVNTLLTIRRGDWSQAGVEKYFMQLEYDVQVAEEKSSLPRYVDRKAISKLITEAYLEHWAVNGEMGEISNFIPVGF